MLCYIPAYMYIHVHTYMYKHDKPANNMLGIMIVNSVTSFGIHVAIGC